MTDFLFIAGIIVAEAAVMWCMYRIGWNIGYEGGKKNGHTEGWHEAAEFYDSALDKLWARMWKEWNE